MDNGLSDGRRDSRVGSARSTDPERSAKIGKHLQNERVPGADELGAHVSSAGGVDRAPARGAERAAAVVQIFTKQPNRWAEPELSPEMAEAFRRERVRCGIRTAGAHDSYLINVASPDAELRARSIACLRGELKRATVLNLDFVVTHPGNATDGDLASGLSRNADAVARVLDEVPGDVRLLLELTAGSGTTVGATFENLATLVAAVPPRDQGRVGVCIDTCHAFAAGYDLVADYEGVWERFGDTLGFDRLGLIHLNDSQHPLGSRKDRHEQIGDGTLGIEPFRRIVTDTRLAAVPKVLETPKGDDPVAADRRNLELLRSLRRGG
jgi:deoxyribonuclease-4